MGYATVSDIDDLDWKEWPKTPSFLYVDINEDVRLQRDTLNTVTPYAVQSDHGPPRGKVVVRHLTKAQVMHELKKLNKWLPCLPLVRPSPYEPTDL